MTELSFLISTKASNQPDRSPCKCLFLFIFLPAGSKAGAGTEPLNSPPPPAAGYSSSSPPPSCTGPDGAAPSAGGQSRYRRSASRGGSGYAPSGIPDDAAAAEARNSNLRGAIQWD